MATAAELAILIKARDDASAKLDGIGRKSEGLGAKLRKLAPFALGAGAAIGGLAFGAKKFADAASDLSEAQNKATVTFGESSDVIEEFAATSARSFGISERAANEYTATLGVILQGSGLAQDATADMSVELTALAADLASFNNIPVDVALEKIRAGLVGEAEPLRTVGVLLSEAAVKTKAYEMGIAEAGTELTDAQKVQARYALILEQTSTAQGDFDRTSDGLANQQRIMGAQWEDLRAKLGQAFLPIMQKVTQGLVNFMGVIQEDVIPAIEEWYEEHQPEIEAALKEFERIMREDVGPMIQRIAEIVEEWWPRIQAVVEKVWPIIENTIVTTMKTIKNTIDIILALLSGDWEGAWEGMKQLVLDIWDGLVKDTLLKLALLQEIVANVLTSIRDNIVLPIFGAIRQGAIDAITSMVSLIMAAVNSLKEGYRTALNWIIDRINDFASGLNAIIETINKVPGVSLPKVGTIPHVATGSSFFPGGLAMVGEMGPELVSLPTGSRVYSNRETEALMAEKERGGSWTIYGRYQIVLPNVRNFRDFQHEQNRQLRGI